MVLEVFTKYLLNALAVSCRFVNAILFSIYQKEVNSKFLSETLAF